jgi:hypothetical protein
VQREVRRDRPVRPRCCVHALGDVHRTLADVALDHGQEALALDVVDERDVGRRPRRGRRASAFV